MSQNKESKIEKLTDMLENYKQELVMIHPKKYIPQKAYYLSPIEEPTGEKRNLNINLSTESPYGFYFISEFGDRSDELEHKIIEIILSVKSIKNIKISQEAQVEIYLKKGYTHRISHDNSSTKYDSLLQILKSIEPA